MAENCIYPRAAASLGSSNGQVEGYVDPRHSTDRSPTKHEIKSARGSTTVEGYATPQKRIFRLLSKSALFTVESQYHAGKFDHGPRV